MPFHWPEFDNDDPGFMLCATELVNGILGGMALPPLPRYQTFRIDNWFGRFLMVRRHVTFVVRLPTGLSP